MTYENRRIEVQVNIGIPMGAGGDSADMDAFLDEHPEWNEEHITSANVTRLRDEFSAWYRQAAPEEWISPEDAAAWAAKRIVQLGRQ